MSAANVSPPFQDAPPVLSFVVPCYNEAVNIRALYDWIPFATVTHPENALFRRRRQGLLSSIQAANRSETM